MALDPGMIEPAQQAIQQHAPDANNPAAQAFAMSRLHQLVRAHLLGSVHEAQQNYSDPTAAWRALSSSFASNPKALQAFLAANRSAQNLPTAHPSPLAPVLAALAPQLISEHGAGMNSPQQASSSFPSGGHQLPRHLPDVHPALVSILSALAHGGGTPY